MGGSQGEIRDSVNRKADSNQRTGLRGAAPDYYREGVMSKLGKKRKQFIFFALVVPMLLLIAFVVFPAIDLFRMSFTNWDGYSPEKEFIGMANYVSMFQNKDLWMSLKNNAVYFFIHLLMIVVELAFAVLLTGKLKAAKFYKTMVFMPYIINGVAISYAFSYFFSPINGAFDAILSAVHLESLIRSWLSDPKIVNYVLALSLIHI